MGTMKIKAEEEPLLLDLLDEHPIHAEEVQPIRVEEVSSSLSKGQNSLPTVKDLARGAAWAGGISGFILGGPLIAFVLGYGGYHFAREDSGELGDFCRKAGDFTNKIGDDIKAKREIDRSKKETESFEGDKENEFLSKVGKLITNFGKSINKRWSEAKSVPLREQTTTVSPNSVSDEMKS